MVVSSFHLVSRWSGLQLKGQGAEETVPGRMMPCPSISVPAPCMCMSAVVQSSPRRSEALQRSSEAFNDISVEPFHFAVGVEVIGGCLQVANSQTCVHNVKDLRDKLQSDFSQ